MDVREFDRARSALHALDPGAERAEWVRAGMAAKAAGLDFEDFHDWSAGAGNYRNEADVSAVWRSIREDGGIQAGTLFGMARAAGWSDEAPRQTHKNRPQRTTERRTHEVPPKAPALDVAALWASCAPATAEHGYIVRKHGLPAGLRVYHGPLTIACEAVAGYLAVPCHSIDGTLKSAQFIPPGEGKKLNAPGLPMDGLSVVGRIPHQGAGVTLYLCEGIGQAWSCHQAANAPAVVCFGSGRMESASKALAERYPLARRVLVADAGKEQHCAHVAKDTAAGWVEMPIGSPTNFDANDLHQRDGLDALAVLLANPKEHPQRFRLFDAEQFAEQPPLEWLVKGLIPRRGTAAAYGASGCGKSFLMLDLIGAMLAGNDWFGMRTTPVPVLYLCLEGAGGFGKRLKAYQQEVGPLAGLRVMTDQFNLTTHQDEADLITAAKASGLAGGMLVIDTLAQATPGMDENSGQDMSLAVAACQRIQAALNCLVLIIHHSGKDAARGLRGHSSLIGALDASIEVTGGASGTPRQWEARKVKDDGAGDAHPFELRRVVLGLDADGDEISSCVVGQADAPADAVRKARIPQGGNQRLLWDGLGELLKASSNFGKAGAPPIRPCVELDAAVDKLRTRLTCASDKQTSRTRDAITGLINRGLVTHREGWLWIS